MGTAPVAWLVLVVAAPPAGGEEFFESRVRPVLVERCVKCHGPDKASGGLRVDSREALLKGGDTGPAIVPGKTQDSLLVKAIKRLDGVEAMPPDKALHSQAVADLEKWVRTGAVWPAGAAPVRAERHWAFEPVRAVKVPQVAGLPPATAQPIDAFLDLKLHEKGLKPASRADKVALIRRATYDLTGLPPTPEEVDAFLADDSPSAWQNLIDRLLASPRYGEKWGRHWLDVVRYADTAGETADFPVPDAWRYRNYVISAFNADMPYNRFIREQVAGDILARSLPPDAPAERYAELITATGYLAIARRFGFDVLHDHYLTIEDTIDTLGKSVLGLTLGCARCHDHKYEPVSTRDYYALYGIFESTQYPNPGCEKEKRPSALVPLASPAASAKVLSTLSGVTGTAAAVRTTAFGPRAYAVWEGQPHDSQLHKRGDPGVRGEVVPRHFLTVLGGHKLPSSAGSGRLELAGWLTDPKNPLTARVMVNRIWQGHFGAGLVATASDFGTRGSPPSHPELLDWLATEFIRQGWSIKAMHRLMMMSEAYQRSSAADDSNLKADAANACLWRFPRRRLVAEEIRDALLAVSGDLDPTPGGSHPFPEPKTWGFSQHNPFSAVYETNRRSVYLMTQRIKRHPFLTLFDGPDPNASTAVRQTTTVPTQALFFMNDPFVHARAESLARKLLQMPESSDRLDRACRLLYGRPVHERERRVAGRFLAAQPNQKEAWASWLRVMFGSNEFIYLD